MSRSTKFLAIPGGDVMDSKRLAPREQIHVRNTVELQLGIITGYNGIITGYNGIITGYNGIYIYMGKFDHDLTATSLLFHS